jgi:hypothetical protein
MNKNNAFYEKETANLIIENQDHRLKYLYIRAAILI